MNHENNPKSVYMNFIDQLVEDSNPISSKLISEDKLFSKAVGHEKYNAFVSKLSSEQRQLLSEMMKCERESAIHDVLASLTWHIECNNVTLNYKGEEMPVQLSGMGLHGDFIGRLSKEWDWP